MPPRCKPPVSQSRRGARCDQMFGMTRSTGFKPRPLLLLLVGVGIKAAFLWFFVASRELFRWPATPFNDPGRGAPRAVLDPAAKGSRLSTPGAAFLPAGPCPLPGMFRATGSKPRPLLRKGVGIKAACLADAVF